MSLQSLSGLPAGILKTGARINVAPAKANTGGRRIICTPPPLRCGTPPRITPPRRTPPGKRPPKGVWGSTMVEMRNMAKTSLRMHNILISTMAAAAVVAVLLELERKRGAWISIELRLSPWKMGRKTCPLDMWAATPLHP